MMYQEKKKTAKRVALSNSKMLSMPRIEGINLRYVLEIKLTRQRRP